MKKLKKPKNLKITDEHYAILADAVETVLIDNPDAVENYEHGRYAKSDTTRDLNRRFAFDVLHAAGIYKEFTKPVYEYANDDNIYAALKTLVPKLERKF